MATVTGLTGATGVTGVTKPKRASQDKLAATAAATGATLSRMEAAARDFLAGMEELRAAEAGRPTFAVEARERGEGSGVAPAARWFVWLADLAHPEPSARMLVSATGPTLTAALYELEHAAEKRRWWVEECGRERKAAALAVIARAVKAAAGRAA